MEEHVVKVARFLLLLVSIFTSFNSPCLAEEISPVWNNLNFLRVFGQKSIRETSRDQITLSNTYHVPGVIVDKSVRPNIVYVADTGNNRILGFKSLGVCSNDANRKCTNNSDCAGGGNCQINNLQKADLVIGQPDGESGSCNGDNNLGLFKNPFRTSLCLLPYPEATNTAEFWQRLNFDVDSQGNLYFPDTYNNRVLIYFAPMSESKTGGKGDGTPDLVLGQENFTSGKVNKDKNQPDNNSLYLGIKDHREGAASRGVSVDQLGNVWVADTFNRRVLRFPPNSNTADLVLGQENFTSVDNSGCYSDKLNRFCRPTLARINPENGKLYVLDETGQGASFPARILIFEGPFINGSAAKKKMKDNQQDYGRLEGWPYDAYPYVFESTGFIFNTYRPVGTVYEKGVLWVNQLVAHRTVLLDEEGEILKVIGAKNQSTAGCIGNDQGCSSTGQLCTPGGQIGIDNENNMYLADETTATNWVIRYSLPYETRQINGQECLPNPSGRFIGNGGPNMVSGKRLSESVGAIVFNSPTLDQLIIRDANRVVAWNNYKNKITDTEADAVVGQANRNVRTQGGSLWLGTRSYHAIDDKNRLWSFNQGSQIIVFDLPLFGDSQRPIANSVELFWEDDPDSPVNFRGRGGWDGAGIAFDKKNKKMWVSDSDNGRLLRIKNYDDIKDYPNKKLLVDMVIGQPSKDSVCCNQEPKVNGVCRQSWTAEYGPRADTLCSPYGIKFDNFGNLYVTDNNYECHGNNRITVFMAEDLVGQEGNIFPNISAKKVFRQDNFTSLPNCGNSRINEPDTPMVVAFNSKNQMVLGNHGYYISAKERATKQLWFYDNPLKKSADGSFLQNQKPDAYVNLPVGAPGEIGFDNEDNFYIQDHTWYRVLVVNFEKDPNLLVYLPGVPRPTLKPLPTGKLSPTPTPETVFDYGCGTKPSGDADCNGKTDITDFGVWKAEFIKWKINGERIGVWKTDFYKDTLIDIKDFGSWKTGFINKHSP